MTNYSRSLARGLDAEVLLDAVADVTGIPETFSTAITEGATVGQAPAGTRADSTARSRHVLLALPGAVRPLQPRRRSGAEQQAEPQPGDACAGRSDLCGPPRPARTAAWRSCSHSGAADEQIFTEFYLAALSREPAADELQELKTILAQRGDREAGLREFVWALISSREFAENH